MDGLAPSPPLRPHGAAYDSVLHRSPSLSPAQSGQPSTAILLLLTQCKPVALSDALLHSLILQGDHEAGRLYTGVNLRDIESTAVEWMHG